MARKKTAAMKRQQERMKAAGRAWRKLPAAKRKNRKYSTFAKPYLQGKKR